MNPAREQIIRLMQKIYLLLRDNQQSGPHTLEELLSLNMKNTDLVWIEGRSMGWAFPAEIETLRPFLPEAEKRSAPMETTPSKNKISSKVYVSLPVQAKQEATVNHMEDKAEAIRKRALSQHPGGADLKKNYSRSLDEVENDYTRWMIRNHKRKNRFSGKKIAIAFIIILGTAGGWLLADMAFNSNETLSAQTENVVVHSATANEILSNDVVDNAPVLVADNKEINTNIPAREKKKKTSAGKPGNEKKNSILSEQQEDQQEPVPVSVNVENVNEEKPGETTAPAKKTTLKEKIGNWLKEGKEINIPAASKEKTLVDITEEVDVRVVKDPSDWMMGVKGQKIILSNRSETKLHSAVVELLYYSEENALLDKKKLEISGFAKGGSKTVSIPDHKMADHVEAKISNAKGE